MIKEITRSYIRLEIGSRTVTVEGEAYAPGYGSPDFVAYSDTIRRWDPPYDDEISEEAKLGIINALKEEMRKRNMSIDIE